MQYTTQQCDGNTASSKNCSADQGPDQGSAAALCNVIGRALLRPGAELLSSWGTAVGVHSLFWRWYVPTCAVFLSAVTPSESPAIALSHSREGT